MNNVEAAWSAYFKASEVADLDALRKEGWKTVEDIAEASGVPWNRIRHKVERDPLLEKQRLRAFHKGQTRNINVYRPRLVENKLSACKPR